MQQLFADRSGNGNGAMVGNPAAQKLRTRIIDDRFLLVPHATNRVTRVNPATGITEFVTLRAIEVTAAGNVVYAGPDGIDRTYVGAVNDILECDGTVFVRATSTATMNGIP